MLTCDNDFVIHMIIKRLLNYESKVSLDQEPV